MSAIGTVGLGALRLSTGPSGRMAVHHPCRMGADAGGAISPPGPQQMPPCTSYEGHLVALDEAGKASELFAVPGNCLSVNRPAAYGPARRFGAEVEQQGPEAGMGTRTIDFGSQAERVLDELRRVEERKQAGIVAQRIPDTFVR